MNPGTARRRMAPLRNAAFVAAGFVVLRVVYRVIFGGASGGGAVLLDLPRIQLGGVFSHVSLLGPVTTGGVWSAAVSALPFACVILAFGLVSSIVDVRALLTRGAVRGPVRTGARALVVAWATFPALLASVKRVRIARELRGERSTASLIVPVLEHTIERALALGASMEVRGFAATHRTEPVCERPVELQDAALGFAGTLGLEAVTLHLAPGTLTLLTGPTGSGKSTLLHALSGLHQHYLEGEQLGSITVAGADRLSTPPRETAGFVGVVAQSVRLSFVAATVNDEIGFALVARGVAPVIVRARVEEVAERLGVSHLLGRSIDALSAGEACLIAIAAALVSHPVLLLVDEPLADLDSAARNRVVAVLDALAHDAGVCVVVAEHNVDEWNAVADARLEIRDRTVVELESARSPRAEASPSSTHAPAPAGLPTHAGAAVAIARRVSVTHGGLTAVHDVSLDIATGELIALCGPNGAGKSSLLHALARPQVRDSIVVRGTDVSTLRARDRRGSIALVPESFDDLLFAAKVDDECRAADRRMAKHSSAAPREGTAAVFARLLGFVSSTDADHLMERHPRDLSAGERLCLVIAIQLGARPAVLMVDEPTRGLDATSRALVGSALEKVAASGSAVIVATHDREFATRCATRTIWMESGRLVLTAAHASVPTGATAPPRADPPVEHTPAAHSPVGRARTSGTGVRGTGVRGSGWALGAASVVAAAGFAWPLVASALPTDARAAVPFVALAVVPALVVAVALLLDREMYTAKTVALLGVLAAIGAAIRIAGTGVGGVEAVFIVLILAGRAFGARFGFLLGMLTIAMSSLLWGGFGPWTPFQLFACGWVGAGAGLLPRFEMLSRRAGHRAAKRIEIVLLVGYGVAASYAFGLVMNLWFWPFAVGGATDISYVAGAGLGQNVASFWLYSLVTSTLTWDTVRAITTTVGVVVVGTAALAALRRAKLGATNRHRTAQVKPRSSGPLGGGTRTRQSTALGEAEAPQRDARPSALA